MPVAYAQIPMANLGTICMAAETVRSVSYAGCTNFPATWTTASGS